MNIFPADFNHALTGFGGDPNMDQAQHRDSIKKTPVILIHGNGANVSHPQWGWDTMRGFLKSSGYQDYEIWAMDYLGENNDRLFLQDPVKNHIDGLREFIDAVIGYLDVQRVDIICHSLGGMMTTAYMKGFKPDGTWDNANHRLNRVGTAVYLASNNYGLDPNTVYEEFKVGGIFEVNSHMFEGTNDDTPGGLNNANLMISPEDSWKVTTSKDTGELPPQNMYVAFTAIMDFVDIQNKDTGRLNGADLNQRFNLGLSTIGHEKIIKDRGVFDSFKGYLNKYPPVSPVSITVDKDSGNYNNPLSIIVIVDPGDKDVLYVAKNVTKEYQAGYIVEVVKETLSGNLTAGQTLVLSTDGVWDVAFSYPGASDVKRIYGVSVTIPKIEIITPNIPKFTGFREVQATASSGKLYFSFDGILFNEGSTVRIDKTSTVYFIAIDKGNASEIVFRYYEKEAAWTEEVSGTPNEHYIAGRIILNEYLTVYGPKYQWVNKYTMYKINGKWTDNPDTPVIDTVAPTVSIDKPEGTYTEVLKLRINAVDDYDAEPMIYWTRDGSTPTFNSPHRGNYVDLVFDVNGTYIVKFFTKDRSGNSSDIITKVYTINIAQPMPDVTSDMPNGEYTQAIDVTLMANNGTIVYYTTDGSEPTESSPSFTGNRQFAISGNGGHLIKVLAINGDNQTRREFVYSINDSVHVLLDTAISPSKGGIFVNSVQITLTPNKIIEWTKYTTDGTDPSDTNGTIYTRTFLLTQGCRLKWRSKDMQGNLEDVHSAEFIITHQTQAIYENNEDHDGYVKATAEGLGLSVGTFMNLAIGCGFDGKHNRALLHFDTSVLPDNAIITRAYVEVEYYFSAGDPFSEGNIKVAIKNGHFGNSQNVQADDFNSVATAEDVAEIASFSWGRVASSDFDQDGKNSINKTGVTQIRLKLPTSLSANNYLFIKKGAHAKLYVEYTV